MISKALNLPGFAIILFKWRHECPITLLPGSNANGFFSNQDPKSNMFGRKYLPFLACSHESKVKLISVFSDSTR